MSNSSEIVANSTFSSVLIIPTLDELLDSFGFRQWFTVVTSFVLPSVSLLGTVLCSLSVYIYFQRKFVDPVFFYYRLLCLSYVVHLALGIPYGLLLTPRYFPQVNTYLSTVYFMFYANATVILFNYEDTLQMAIVLTRMKIFSPFVSRYFTLEPKYVSLIFFIVCFGHKFTICFCVKYTLEWYLFIIR
jgi:hypothetical protein